MRILLIGAGAEGLGLGSFLIDGGADLDIVCRSASAGPLRSSGLHREGILGRSTITGSAFRTFTNMRLLPWRPYDFILVCTKSHDAETVAAQFTASRSVVGPGTRIVLFMNGWGNAAPFEARFPATRVFGARVITGFRKLYHNHVEVTVHGGDILLGSFSAVAPIELEPLAGVLTLGGIPTRVTDALRVHIWEKIAYNCAVNGLGAIWDEPIGIVAAEPDACLIIERIVEEVFAVMKAASIPTRWPSPAEFLAHFYQKLLPATAGHVSSTTSDLREHKRTEVDYLNGAVVKLAAHHRVPVPENLLVLKAIKRAEMAYSHQREGAAVEQAGLALASQRES